MYFKMCKIFVEKWLDVLFFFLILNSVGSFGDFKNYFL